MAVMDGKRKPNRHRLTTSPKLLDDLVSDGETHVEVLKRLTGCGMGPCQGTPCWDYLGAALEHLTGQAAASFGHPSYRAPRGGLLLALAGGLADLVEPEPHS